MDSILMNLTFNFPNHHSFSVLSFKNSQRLQRSSITVKKYSNPKNPISQSENYSSPLKKVSVFVPIIKKFKDFCSPASLPTEFEGNFLQNGAFGTALLSVTSTAKVKISPFVATLAANPTFVSGFFAWAIAQSTKVFLNFWVERKWDFSLMFASGGMPSSHSALCTALTTSVAICHGVADSLFPVCLGFSLIVMYDAIGVRRHAGMQAEVIYFLYPFNLQFTWKNICLFYCICFVALEKLYLHATNSRLEV